MESLPKPGHGPLLVPSLQLSREQGLNLQGPIGIFDILTHWASLSLMSQKINIVSVLERKIVKYCSPHCQWDSQCPCPHSAQNPSLWNQTTPVQERSRNSCQTFCLFFWILSCWTSDNPGWRSPEMELSQDWKWNYYLDDDQEEIEFWECELQLLSILPLSDVDILKNTGEWGSFCEALVFSQMNCKLQTWLDRL